MTKVKPHVIEEIRALAASDPGLTQADCVKRFDVQSGALSRALGRAGIKLRHALRVLPADDVLKAELPHMTSREAVEHFGVHRTTILEHADRLGIELLPVYRKRKLGGS